MADNSLHGGAIQEDFHQHEKVFCTQLQVITERCKTTIVFLPKALVLNIDWLVRLLNMEIINKFSLSMDYSVRAVFNDGLWWMPFCEFPFANVAERCGLKNTATQYLALLNSSIYYGNAFFAPVSHFLVALPGRHKVVSPTLVFRSSARTYHWVRAPHWE